MYVVLKNDIDINNISIFYNYSYNFYKIYYDLNYIKILGIPFEIKYDHWKYENNLYFIYIKDKKSLEQLQNIEILLKSKITCFNILRKLKHEYYIICKYNNGTIENNKVTILMNKIKYLNNNYVPIINII